MNSVMDYKFRGAEISSDLFLEKRFNIIYLGFQELDRCYAESTTPWIVAEIKRREDLYEVTLKIYGSSVMATSAGCSYPKGGSLSILFQHNAKSLSRFYRMRSNPCCFSYLRRSQTSATNSYECHAFMALDEYTVDDIFSSIREASKRQVTETSSTDLSPDENYLSTNYAFYEVEYVGHAKLVKKWLQSSDIDDMTEKINMRVSRRPNNGQVPFDCSSERSFVNGNNTAHSGQGGDFLGVSPEEQSAGSLPSNSWLDVIINGSILNKQFAECNRTMLLRLGNEDVALISPDTKTSVIDLSFLDIACVSQGLQKPDVFGFVARNKEGGMVCHLLRCHDQTVATEIMKAFQIAFNSAYEVNKVETCNLCPLLQFHNLCRDIADLNAQTAFELVRTRVSNLPDEDSAHLDLVYDENGTFEELLESFMIELRKLCEEKQKMHTHRTNLSHKSQGVSPFTLSSQSKSSKLSNLKNKAKKSLTSSFETFLRQKKNDDNISQIRKRHPSFDTSVISPFSTVHDEIY